MYAAAAPIAATASILFQHKGSPLSADWQAKGPIEDLHTIVISASNAEVFGWVDAKQCAKSKAATANNPFPSYIGYIDGWGKMVGDIYCVRIYNRALDDKELRENHAVDRKRFAN